MAGGGVPMATVCVSLQFSRFPPFSSSSLVRFFGGAVAMDDRFEPADGSPKVDPALCSLDLVPPCGGSWISWRSRRLRCASYYDDGRLIGGRDSFSQAWCGHWPLGSVSSDGEVEGGLHRLRVRTTPRGLVRWGMPFRLVRRARPVERSLGWQQFTQGRCTLAMIDLT